MRDHRKYTTRLSSFTSVLYRIAESLSTDVFASPPLTGGITRRFGGTKVQVLDSIFFISRRNECRVRMAMGDRGKGYVPAEGTTRLLSMYAGEEVYPTRGRERILKRRCRAVMYIRKPKCCILRNITGVKGGKRGVSNSDFLVGALPNKGRTTVLSSKVKSNRETLRRDKVLMRVLRRLLKTKFPIRATLSVVGATLIVKQRRIHFSAISVDVFSLCGKGYRFMGTKTTIAFLQAGSKIRRVHSRDLPLKMVRERRDRGRAERLRSKSIIIVMSSKVLSTLPTKRRRRLLSLVVNKDPLRGPRRLTGCVLSGILRLTTKGTKSSVAILITKV